MPYNDAMSDSEQQVMQIIWQSGGRILLAPLMEALERQGKSWKTNTVLTFLARLVDKGLLKTAKQGRLNEYIAQISEQDYLESLTHSFVGKVYGGDAKGLVATLLRQDALSAEDIAELQEFWKGGDDDE